MDAMHHLCDDLPQIRDGMELDADVFGCIEGLLTLLYGAAAEGEMGRLAMTRGFRSDLPERDQCFGLISGLFEKLAARGFERIFACFDHSRRQFQREAPVAVSVLPH